MAKHKNNILSHSDIELKIALNAAYAKFKTYPTTETYNRLMVASLEYLNRAKNGTLQADDCDNQKRSVSNGDTR